MITTLNRLCSYSDDGYSKSIEVLDCSKAFRKPGTRFKIIIQTLNLLLMNSEKTSTNNENYYKQLSSSNREKYILELLTFINNLTKSPRDLKDRWLNRHEFISLKLLEIFKSLNKLYPQQNSLINAEITTFISLRNNEEYEYGDIDLNSHIDVFHALFSQVQDTSNEQLFISLLRHLLKIDSSSKLGNFIWEVTEKLVCRAALFDRDDRLLSDALERYTDDKFKSMLNVTPRDNTVPKTQQPMAVQAPMPPPPPPPPFSELILPKKTLRLNELVNESVHQRQSMSPRLNLENKITGGCSLKISVVDDAEQACNISL